MKILISLFFLTIIGLYTFSLDIDSTSKLYVMAAAVIGGYMAINIGANDVANNVGPAVGSKALTILGAVVIAAIFEFSGAMIAGGEVVKTIKKGIIDIGGFSDPMTFIYAMMSALLAAAIWLNIATYFRAPVSTTHSIVGGIMGSGIAALGVSIVQWGTVGKIVLSWFISPIVGGIVAALFLYMIKTKILFKEDKVTQSKIWVPVFVAIMAWAFSTYIIVKGLKQVLEIDFALASMIGLLVAFITYFLVKDNISRKASRIGNDRESINKLFTIPLICAAALLSFAHGANDVANAIGPLAAIYDAAISGDISGEVNLPIWIMLIGAGGIVVGLALFGPRIIKTVGQEITQLDQIRGFSVALSASITVLIASQLGLPVSSTHIALGGIFGVGFLREYLDRKNGKKKEIYVKRNQLWKIIATWIITVPIVAILSGMIFLGLSILG